MRIYVYLCAVVLVFCGSSLSGCAAMYKVKVDFDPAEPIRVAVLPFYQEDDGQIVQSDYPLFQTPEINAKRDSIEEPPAFFVQKLVQSRLEDAGFDVVPSRLVMADLIHHGFTKDVAYDFKRIEQTSPKALCKLLVCDALVYGKLTDWSQTYYGVQSVSTVALEVKLLRAVDGMLLYTAQVDDSDSRGLTKGPTGYTSVVLEPLKGLRDEVIENLARTVVTRMFEPLRRENLPGFKDSPSPMILATSHSAAAGKLAGGESLLVLMTGSAGMDASFSIGDSVRNIPMDEVEPMHYVGEYFPVEGDAFVNAPVQVSLVDKFGRRIAEAVGLGPVSLSQQ